VDIDKDGHRMILDYKTGESTAGKALGERPDAPQLPAYLLAEQDKGLTVDALAFAQVRFQGLGFKGFAQEDGVLPDIKAYKGRKDAPQDWDALTQHWQDSLNNLADEFMAGGAAVKPKNAQACTYCDFKSLCRIQRI
jgi:ATP-dependent helicase/DNAse subunit B